MKKILVLSILFLLPLTVYMFFAASVHYFAKLPSLHKVDINLSSFRTLEDKPVDLVLKDRITVLSFFGRNLDNKKGHIFNLCQKIYKKNYQFSDFQFVTLVPRGTQKAIEDVKQKLKATIDFSNWHFITTTDDKQIQEAFKALKTPYTLDDNLATDYVFIIGKSSFLRGRDGSIADDGEKIIGYDASNVASLTNTMVDDIKIILAEYRLSLKKYNKNIQTAH